MSSVKASKAKNPTKVLIVGGYYAGLAAALNLSDLCSGKPSRGGHPPTPPEVEPQPILPIEIKILDERDGFCKKFSISTIS
jgi:thioredoxin reductase